MCLLHSVHPLIQFIPTLPGQKFRHTEDCFKVPWTCTVEKRRGQKSVLRGQRGGVANFLGKKVYTTIMFSAEILRDLV